MQKISVFYLVLINRRMKIKDIRTRLAYDASARQTHKSALRSWLATQANNWPLALTLTVKQTLRHKTAKGEFVRVTTTADCAAMAKKFMQKLNKCICGNAAARHGKGIKCFAVIEGERRNKRLHLHFALGKLPTHIKYNEIGRYIEKAKNLVEGIDKQYKLDIADRGWLVYITKEVGTKDTDNVLWELM